MESFAGSTLGCRVAILRITDVRQLFPTDWGTTPFVAATPGRAITRFFQDTPAAADSR